MTGQLLIPADPDDLSAQWLTIALRATGIIASIAVTAIEVTIIGSDRGFTGVVARVQITYDRPEPSAPATVVAKFPLVQPAGSSYREAQQTSPEQVQHYWDRCAREIRFYRELGPGIAFAPRVFGAWADPTAQRMLLLLEDLSAGQPGDALLGCSIAQATSVVDELAGFHARWWGHAREPEPAWLPRWGSDPATMAARFRRQLEPVLDRYSDRIPAPVASLTRELAAGYLPMLDTLTQRPATIIHGDLHLDNLIFTSDAGPVLLDWQGIAAGPAIADLGLFLVGSLSVADRRAAEMNMLARYHQRLTADGVDGYALDDLIADYHRSLVWQLAGITGWLARVDLASLAWRERALVEALFTPGQVIAACADHAGRLRQLAQRPG